jgi:ribosomal protein L33
MTDQVFRDRTKLEENQTNKVFNIQSVQMKSIITLISRHCTMFDPEPVRIRFRQNNRKLQPARIELKEQSVETWLL